MIKGIGVDILSIQKLVPILEKENYVEDSFIRKTYTPREISLAEARPNPIYTYATRFAGKEAVFKALNVTGEDLHLNEIEILSTDTGKPYIVLHGKAKDLAESAEISHVLISLSYEDDTAIAYALAE
ncbi:MAG: holo-ACP synthase [Agathobacter sp.]|nr:holo-ACP synthase [Agathobacter sp.]